MRFPAFGAYIRLKTAATGSSFHKDDDDVFASSFTSLTSSSSSGKARPPPRTKKNDEKARCRRASSRRRGGRRRDAFGKGGCQVVAPPFCACPTRRKNRIQNCDVILHFQLLSSSSRVSPVSQEPKRCSSRPGCQREEEEEEEEERAACKRRRRLSLCVASSTRRRRTEGRRRRRRRREGGFHHPAKTFGVRPPRPREGLLREEKERTRFFAASKRTARNHPRRGRRPARRRR